MAKFNFNVSTAKPNKPASRKTKKVILYKHTNEVVTNEMYTYLNANGEETQFVGVLTKTPTGAYGKISESSDVVLTYHPAVEHVNGSKEYFTYFDEESNEHQVYKGKVEYDLERNTYIGIISDLIINQKLIQIFEEK